MPSVEVKRSGVHSPGEPCHAYVAHFNEHRVAFIDAESKTTKLIMLGRTVQAQSLEFTNENAVLPFFSTFHVQMTGPNKASNQDIRHIRIHWIFGFIPFGQYQLQQLG